MNICFVLTHPIHQDVASSNLMRAYSKYGSNKFSYRCYCSAPLGINSIGFINNSYYEYVLNLNSNSSSLINKIRNKILLILSIIYDCFRGQFKNDIVYIYHISSPLLIFIYSNIYRAKGIDTWLYRTEIPYTLYKKPQLKLFYKIIYSSINHLIVETNKMKSFYRKILKPNASINVLYSSLDCSDIQLVDKMQNIPKYIAFCGIISSEEKDGLILSIEGFSKILKYHNELYFYIVGDNCNELYYKSLKKTVHNLNIENKVIFTGKVSREKYVWFLKNAFLLINCKQPGGYNSYGLSSKVIEYLYSGNPVLMTKADEYKDILIDMRDVIFIEYCSDSFFDKVIWALANEQEVKIIGEHGKEKANIFFSCDKLGEKLLFIVDGSIK